MELKSAFSSRHIDKKLDYKAIVRDYLRTDAPNFSYYYDHYFQSYLRKVAPDWYKGPRKNTFVQKMELVQLDLNLRYIISNKTSGLPPSLETNHSALVKHDESNALPAETKTDQSVDAIKQPQSKTVSTVKIQASDGTCVEFVSDHPEESIVEIIALKKHFV